MKRELPVRFREGLGVQFPRATRLVICCQGSADEALSVMRVLMEKLKLTVNETKTRLCRVPDEAFDFLGYRIGRCYSRQTGRSYIGTQPSVKAVRRVCQAVSETTDRRRTQRSARAVVGDLNRQLLGWANYFCVGSVRASYQAVMNHTCWRLRQWLSRKGKVRGAWMSRYPDRYLHGTLGLIDLASHRKAYLSSCVRV